jgi:hypothetical protein
MKALEALRVNNYETLKALRARNYKASWALRARNNEIMEREDSERRVKKEEKLGMPKRNDYKREHPKNLLYHHVIMTLCVNH